MAANPPREQEQSIKDRKRLLYDDDDVPLSSPSAIDRKPFAVYLRETPALPISTPLKAALWAVAIVVGLLFAAAAMRSMQGKSPTKKRAEVQPPTASSAWFV